MEGERTNPRCFRQIKSAVKPHLFRDVVFVVLVAVGVIAFQNDILGSNNNDGVIFRTPNRINGVANTRWSWPEGEWPPPETTKCMEGHAASV